MATALNPYLHFDGTAREAMDFYQSVFGGQLDTSTYADFGQGEAGNDRLIHSHLATDGGFTFMASDVPDGETAPSGSQHSMSLSGDDDEALRGYFEKLSDGGTVIEPLGQAPWGDWFGMLVDRFGVPWMVNIAGQAA
ncbi:VOC family protein [Aeromicrobium phragmitis]|uniref:VOC family protein n=1 Tax=Aeromicrobium phragmitis TaxID=2478914 RepID=A0A3L8PNK5_9ACTN|nr:VOC family protein [Aeromicrobium phragmitis]RLV56098.1 VOC family protein [Aeromicrobium phragmitis]